MQEREYPAEFRALVVHQVSAGRGIRAVAQEHAVPEQLLRVWLREGGLRVPIWSGCAPEIADAVDRFSTRWGPYSSKSKAYPIYRLLEEVIDPALLGYADRLPAGHPSLVVGFPGLGTEHGLSALARANGFDDLERHMREALRLFLRLSDYPCESNVFVATMETLIGMVAYSASKRSRKLKARDHEYLNARRQGRALCELCGKHTELGAYLRDGTWPGPDDADVSNKLRLSHRYCSEHRPMMGGVWDASYKCAIRSKAKFEVEVVRLGKLSGARSFPSAKTGSGLVDQYIWNYAKHHNLS